MNLNRIYGKKYVVAQNTDFFFEKQNGETEFFLISNVSKLVQWFERPINISI